MDKLYNRENQRACASAHRDSSTNKPLDEPGFQLMQLTAEIGATQLNA
jgi:hypothetical protein